MYLTVKQQAKHLSKEEFKVLRELCRYAKNLYNQALYNIRLQYFSDGSYLSYGKNYALLKDSPNYRALNSNMAQQILKETDGCFRSFFGLVKKAKRGEYPIKDCRIPPLSPERRLRDPGHRIRKSLREQTGHPLLTELSEDA